MWIRLAEKSATQYREAILVRKATDYSEKGTRKSSLGFGRESTGWGAGAGKLAEGIGIDTRRYIDSLLALNR